jgi:hypothetical protein
MNDEMPKNAIDLDTTASNTTASNDAVEELPLKVRALRSTLRTSLSAGTFRVSPVTKKPRGNT